MNLATANTGQHRLEEGRHEYGPRGHGDSAHVQVVQANLTAEPYQDVVLQAPGSAKVGTPQHPNP